MLVDDEPDVRRVASLSLERVGGHSVRCVGSGRAALEAVACERPDLVVLDVMMPGLDGPETLRELRADPDYHGIPVIFLTARAQPEYAAEYARLGAAGVIGKPFDPLTLPLQIAEILQR